jgi:hypothetical protein
MVRFEEEGPRPICDSCMRCYPNPRDIGSKMGSGILLLRISHLFLLVVCIRVVLEEMFFVKGATHFSIFCIRIREIVVSSYFPIGIRIHRVCFLFQSGHLRCENCHNVVLKMGCDMSNTTGSCAIWHAQVFHWQLHFLYVRIE